MPNEIVKPEETAIDSTNPTAGSIWTSITAETRDERAKLYAAVSDAESLEEHIGERLNVVDVVIEGIEVQDPLTQEMRPANRIVLVCEDGSAYASVSTGVEGAIKKMFSIIGSPTWTPALPIVAEKRPGKNGFKFTTLNLWKG